jgi:hypothetical protein
LVIGHISIKVAFFAFVGAGGLPIMAETRASGWGRSGALAWAPIHVGLPTWIEVLAGILDAAEARPM